MRIYSYVCTAACFYILMACSITGLTGSNRTFPFYYESALQAFNEGRDEKAEKLFKLALQKNPRNSLSHYYVAVLHSEK